MPTTLPSPEQRRKKRSRRSETVAAVARPKEARTSRVPNASRPSPSQGTASRGKSGRARAYKPTRDDEAADWRLPRLVQVDARHVVGLQIGLDWAGPYSTTFGPNGPALVGLGQAARVKNIIL